MLASEHRLGDDIADHLCVRQRLAVGAVGDIAEGIKSKFKDFQDIARYRFGVTVPLARARESAVPPRHEIPIFRPAPSPCSRERHSEVRSGSARR